MLNASFWMNDKLAYLWVSGDYFVVSFLSSWFWLNHLAYAYNILANIIPSQGIKKHALICEWSQKSFFRLTKYQQLHPIDTKFRESIFDCVALEASHQIYSKYHQNDTQHISTISKEINAWNLYSNQMSDGPMSIKKRENAFEIV